MSLKYRFTLIAVLCAAGLCLLCFVGHRGLSLLAGTSSDLVTNGIAPVIAEDYPKVMRTRGALECFVRADRAAYQADMQVVRVRSMIDEGDIETATRAANTAIDQTGEYVEGAAKDGGLAGPDLAKFTGDYVGWAASERRALALSADYATLRRERAAGWGCGEEAFKAVSKDMLKLDGALRKTAASAEAVKRVLTVERYASLARLSLKNLTAIEDRHEMELAIADFNYNVGDVYDNLDCAVTVAPPGMADSLAAFRKSFGAWMEEANKLMKLGIASASNIAEYRELEIVRATRFDHAHKDIDALVGTVEARVPVLEKHIDGRIDDLRGKNAAATMESRRVMALFIIVSLFVAAAVVILIVATANRTLRVMRAAMAELGQSSSHVRSASNAMEKSSCTLSGKASEQVEVIGGTMNALESILSYAKKNAENASVAADGVRMVCDETRRGAVTMEGMLVAMRRIEESSRRTSEIADQIGEIAFKTNLLALNAAVEASRAGEAGAGFSVVAEEVRRLAESCAEAARESAERVQDSRAFAAEGVRLGGELESVLRGIEESVGGVSSMVEEVVASSNEETACVERVAASARQVRRLNEETALNAEETASASEELAAQGVQLEGVVRDLGRLVDGRNANGPLSVSGAKSGKDVRPKGRIVARLVPAPATLSE